MGVVLETFPGDNGLVRKAKIKTANAVYDRPIHKLCLIARREELENPSEEVVLLAADCGSLELESWKPPELLCGSSKRNLHIVMEGKPECDLLLLQEIIVSEPYQYKVSTRERGKIWEDITERLNANEAFAHRLGQKRAVRDRYALLSKKYKK
ncbi:hypothetical protein P5673_028755 [Acropora cervicornis]|uniref:DUF5641 domain-containing protein n=1 Tax=Acropora cervicornis TaxID=6130 RepID=A0AAD9PWM8_ACRCE|nr:hypothetical protein P5673_028755 [Acropora cervicornis]